MKATCYKLQNCALALLACLALLVGGCASRTPPLAYQLLTSGLVVESLRNSPQTAARMRSVQPILCELTTARIVDPKVFVDAVDPYLRDDRDAAALFLGVEALYVGAVGNLSPTNQGAAWPYADAIFCAGVSNGLFTLSL